MDSAPRDTLHWALQGSHVLFPGIHLDSFAGFLAGTFVTVIVCVSERLLNFAHEKGWRPAFIARSRWRHAVWRTAMYWIMTVLRLAYMLIAMSFHVGLVLVVATSLSSVQLFIELHKITLQERDSQRQPYTGVSEPLLHVRDLSSGSDALPSRTKTKPQGIYIQPEHSNVARANAVAIELGLTDLGTRQGEDKGSQHARDNSSNFRLTDEEDSDAESPYSGQY